MTETSSKTRNRRRSNGEGAIWEDKARGRWVGSVTTEIGADGKQRRRSVTGKTRADVIRKLDELRTLTSAGMNPAPENMSVATYLNTWLDTPSPKWRPLTTENYRQVVRSYIIPHIGQVRLRKLSPADVENMIYRLATGDPDATPPRRPLSPNTQRLARAVLRRALRQAERDGLVPRNVARLAEGVEVPRGRGRSLTVEQARQLLDAVAGTRLEAAVTLALSLGLRRGELLGLTWSDVDIDRNVYRLTVRRALKRLPGVGLTLDEPKTTTSLRTVHLPPQLAAVLKAHRVRQNEERLRAGSLWHPLPLGHDLVFRQEDGRPIDPDNFRHAIYNATTEAGIGRWSPHELRHSAASLLIAAGVELKLISELLGHSSIRVTADVYGHLLEAGKDRTAAAMGDVLWGKQA